MIPETCEPLSFADTVLITRINLCCGAFGLFVFALLVDGIGTGGKVLVLLISAVLVLLARQMGAILDWLDRGDQGGGRHVLINHYLILF
jgi:hypothetical protein